MDKNEIEAQAKQIVDEGKRLYKSEMASWLGTDILCEWCIPKEESGGYFSYEDGDIVKCVFFSKETTPNVIATISFDSTFNAPAVDLSQRSFTEFESDLFAIRSTALKTINGDQFFKIYPKTGLNLVPLVSNGEKKVYVLTTAQEAGVLIFGNDYLLTFDHENKLINKKQIHQNIIVTDFRAAEIPDGAKIVAGHHIHLPETGDLITATDVCTLMLYEKFAELEWYYVGSKNYISVWNCLTDELTIRHEGLKNK